VSAINAEWHRRHRMPARATLDERVTWHLAHLKACACRSDLPASVRAELKRRGVKIEWGTGRHARGGRR
jgi:hypothetical protein